MIYRVKVFLPSGEYEYYKAKEILRVSDTTTTLILLDGKKVMVYRLGFIAEQFSEVKDSKN